MRQRQIFKEIAETHNITQKNAKEIVNSFLDTCKKEIINFNKINIKNFGDIYLQKYKTKKAQIPGKTGGVVVPEHYKLQFKPAAKLKSEIVDLPQ